MVTRNVSLRLDYSYYDYGSETFHYNFGLFTGTAEVDTKADVVTLGVNYRF